MTLRNIEFNSSSMEKRRAILRLMSLLIALLLVLSSVYAGFSLRQGDSGSEVQKLQSKLISLGYPIVADGKYGMATHEAIKSFQISKGLFSDGVAGAKTLAELDRAVNGTSTAKKNNSNSRIYTSNPIKGTLKLGDNASAVGIMQKRLIELNYPIERADSVYGERTRDIVKIFQRLNGLKDDGKAGKSTLDLMFSENAKKYNNSNIQEPRRSPKNTQILKLGDKGSEVSLMQGRLIALNYPNLKQDGSFGRSTENALKLFQMRNGLKVDGKAGSSTLDRLYSDRAIAFGENNGKQVYKKLKLGDKGEEVSRFQRRLLALGYPIPKVDGSFGRATENTVKLFQRLNGLNADGVMGAQSQKLLYSENARPNSMNQGNGQNDGNNGNNGQNNGVIIKAYVSTGRSTKLNLRLSPSAKSKNIIATLANGTEIDVLDKGASWCKVSYNGQLGYVMTKFLSFNKPNVPAPTNPPVPTSAPKPTQKPPVVTQETPNIDIDTSRTIAGDVGTVHVRHWFSQVKPQLRSGMKLQVYHPISKSSYILNVYSRGRHLDAEPATKEDTQILNKAFGKASWNINPVFVKLPSGEWTLATMHNMPHLSGSIKDNDFDGHLCVHFLRDLEETQKHDPNYGMQNQKAIRDYFNRLSR